MALRGISKFLICVVCWILVGGRCVSTLPQRGGDLPVRLAGGPSTGEGRLEVYRDSRWESVCVHGWDAVDASVVCGQLEERCGYALPMTAAIPRQVQYSSSSGSSDANYPKVRGTRVACDGSERSLQACTFEPSREYCSTYAGVACNVSPERFASVVRTLTEKKYPFFGDTFRVIFEEDGSSSGRVFFLEDHRTLPAGVAMASGGVCDMNQQTADMLCRDAGYRKGGKPIYLRPIPHLPMLIANVTCDGPLASLKDMGCPKHYTVDGTCRPDGVLHNGVHCYEDLSRKAVALIVLVCIFVVTVLLAGFYVWYRKRGQGKNFRVPHVSRSHRVIEERHDVPSTSGVNK